jgi:hypothetical protein
VNMYGPATDSEKQEQEALVQEQGAQVQGREEARRGADGPRYGLLSRRAPLQWHT